MSTVYSQFDQHHILNYTTLEPLLVTAYIVFPVALVLFEIFIN